MSPTPIAIAIVEYVGRFLIGRREAGVALAGLWEFPGGKLEPGETAPQAAVRECHEETGLAVVVTGSYPSHLETYEHGSVLLHFIDCKPVDPAQTPLPPFRWVGREELKMYEFPTGNRGILALLQNESAQPTPLSDDEIC